MTDTECKLTALHRSVALRLEDICDTYLQLTKKEALRRAALNQLPFPTFRISSSQKAPVLVSIKDLADHLDTVQVTAKKEWDNSQL